MVEKAPPRLCEVQAGRQGECKNTLGKILRRRFLRFFFWNIPIIKGKNEKWIKIHEKRKNMKIY